ADDVAADDGLRVADVGVQVTDVALGTGDHQGARVHQHDRVVVHVDDPRVGRCRLRDLVHVRRRRNSGADVKELPDSRLGGEVPDAAEQKTAVLLRTDPDGGKGLLDFVGGA